MIVRVSSEGQYELDDAELAALNELDGAAHDAVKAHDEQAFHVTFTRLLEFVRANGTPVAEDHLSGSDLILPPPDVTLDEAAGEFDADGLIPG